MVIEPNIVVSFGVINLFHYEGWPQSLTKCC